MMEGSLSKWTNVMKGWQYRWFVLDENAGLLSYYTVSDVSILFSLPPIAPNYCDKQLKITGRDPCNQQFIYLK